MKSTTVLNQSIFRQFGGSTTSISSAVMVCHPLAGGQYTGIVYHNNNRVGEFIVHSDEKSATAQADIDLSKFIRSGADDCGCSGNKKEYKIKAGGYLVFFSSQGENGFHAELTSAEMQKEGSTYSTQKLLKGDVVVSMLLRPGAYEVSGANKSSLSLIVDAPQDYKEYERYLETPNLVTLSDKGFSPATIKAMPGQGLVVKLETDSNVEVKLLKATAVKEERTPLQTHRWIKPTTPVFKRGEKK